VLSWIVKKSSVLSTIAQDFAVLGAFKQEKNNSNKEQRRKCINFILPKLNLKQQRQSNS